MEQPEAPTSRRLELLFLILLAGLALSCRFLSHAFHANGSFGFPLDDPWIHLQFARNLRDFGAFSYFRDEMVTAGSTSPLYTLLLAAGFFVTRNEMILSYFLGVSGLLVAAAYLHGLCRRQFHSTLMGLGAALLLVLEPRMQWAAISGMETSLFICLLLAGLYHYRRGQPTGFGIAAGLLVWTRPESLVFLAAVLLDALYHARIAAPAKRRSAAWLKRPALIAGAMGLAYAGLNLHLSGSLFPNTLAAKLTYYSVLAGKGYPTAVFHYLAEWHMVGIIALIFLALPGILFRVVRGREFPECVPLAFSFGLFLAAWIKIPVVFQEGRYLMPIIPFLLLLAFSGLQTLTPKSGRWLGVIPLSLHPYSVQLILLAPMVSQFFLMDRDQQAAYATQCRYIADRQVRTGWWLRDNTPPDAVIATHDVGAIAFYSERKIFDMVGLVSPDMIAHIRDLDRLKEILGDQGVTHLATIWQWFDISNQNPLFTAAPGEPEPVDVYVFAPARTHFTPEGAAIASRLGGNLIRNKMFERAELLLAEGLKIDPNNARIHDLLGLLALEQGDLSRAETEFSKALKLNPDLTSSQDGLARVAERKRGD